jgi:hypothetical protein
MWVGGQLSIESLIGVSLILFRVSFRIQLDIARPAPFSLQ